MSDAIYPEAGSGSGMGETLLEDRYLKPGTPVRLTYPAEGDPEGRLTFEDGIVIHCWWDDELGGHDCYVAFFGDAIPSGRPDSEPYVLRYASTSLVVLAPPSWALKLDDRAREEDRAEQSGGNFHLWTLGFLAVPPLIGLVMKLLS